VVGSVVWLHIWFGGVAAYEATRKDLFCLGASAGKQFQN
jgi:hypothetical protein